MHRQRGNYSPLWGRYRVTNRRTNEVATVDAEYAGDAVESLGWRLSECSTVCVGPYVQLPDGEKQAILRQRWAR